MSESVTRCEILETTSPKKYGICHLWLCDCHWSHYSVEILLTKKSRNLCSRHCKFRTCFFCGELRLTKIVSLIVTDAVESFVMRLQEKMDKEGSASPVDMDIVRFVHIIIHYCCYLVWLSQLASFCRVTPALSLDPHKVSQKESHWGLLEQDSVCRPTPTAGIFLFIFKSIKTPWRWFWFREVLGPDFWNILRFSYVFLNLSYIIFAMFFLSFHNFFPKFVLRYF